MVTGVTALQSRSHPGGVYALFSHELAKESNDFPVNLLNPAPQCFSGTSLLLNRTAAHIYFCGFSVPGTTVLLPLGSSAPLCPRTYSTVGKKPYKSNSHNQDRLDPDKQLFATQHRQDMVPSSPMGTACTEALRGWLLSHHSLLGPKGSQPNRGRCNTPYSGQVHHSGFIGSMQADSTSGRGGQWILIEKHKTRVDSVQTTPCSCLPVAGGLWL